MKKTVITIIGTSLLVSSLYAGSNNVGSNSSNNHMGNHLHNGKMANHMNPNGMTDTQIKNMNPLEIIKMVDGYKVTIKSNKALTDGKNDISVILKKATKIVKNAEVKILLSMPSMPGMEFTQETEIKDSNYKAKINFSMGGEWAYTLLFKTLDEKIHELTGKVMVK